MDQVDLKILEILQKDARTPNAEIARRIGLAPSATLERIRKLERQGTLRGYAARIEPVTLGLGLLAFVFVRSRERAGAVRTGKRLAAIPEVQEIHQVAGEDCFLVKVRAANPQALGELLRERFGNIAGVDSTRTTIVLETLKETSSLPVPRSAKGRTARGRV
jgi:Lrp/AsnC family leucine-responsive transcriptional regulator